MKFCQKEKLKIKFQKLSNFGGFQFPEMKKEKEYKWRDFNTWLSICTQNIGG
jgi:hypothetical protein